MKRLIALIIAAGVLLMAGAANAVWAKENSPSDKIICQATIEDGFSDDCVIVTIDRNHGGINKFFSKEKFKGVDLTSVEDLTYIEGDPDDNEYLNVENFTQILKLKLVKTGKKEVLKAIRKLEKLDFVLAAEPDYFITPSFAEDYSESNDASNADILDAVVREEPENENIEPSKTNAETNNVNTAHEINEKEQQAEEPVEAEGADGDIPEAVQPSADENEAADDAASPLSTTPNDPQYSSQWGLGAIKAPQAWDVTTGNAASTPMSQRVMVGVIDSGVADHPDLAGNVYWELARDFYHGTAGKDAVTDDLIYKNNRTPSSHGTSVAGIIGAKGNNGTGVSGVCWNVAIVPMQVLITEGEGKGKFDNSAILSAINYAIEKKIPILNCSFGGYGTSTGYDRAIENYKGLLVCSAGNEKKNTDVNSHLPSGLPYDHIISVAATKANSVYLADENDWDYDGDGNPNGSNYGVTTVDIAAPGTTITTTAHTGVDPSGYVTDFCGTSAAAPFVSGVAALILSVRPDLPSTHLKYLLTGYASGMSELNGKVANGAFLNASSAVNAAMNQTVKVTFNTNGGSCEESYRYYVKGRKYWNLPKATRNPQKWILFLPASKKLS